jgi:hypothetical protein
MRTRARLAFTAVALTLAAAACGPLPAHTGAAADAVGVTTDLTPATQTQLDTATLTTADVAGAHMTAHPPMPHSAAISAEATQPLPKGECAPIATAWQAGEPAFPSSASTDVELNPRNDTSTVLSVHLGAYTRTHAHDYLSALASALRTCQRYTERDLQRTLRRQHITALHLSAGDEAVAWQQESVTSDGGTWFLSVAVVRVGSTVITAVLDRDSSTAVPLIGTAVLDTQIRKIRLAVR